MKTQSRRSNAEMLAEIDADRDEPIGPAIDGAPVRAISDAVARRHTVDAQIAELVTEARTLGISWTLIGEALGVSRQAARQRYASD